MGLWGKLNLGAGILAVFAYFAREAWLIDFCIFYTLVAGLMTFIAEMKD